MRRILYSTHMLTNAALPSVRLAYRQTVALCIAIMMSLFFLTAILLVLHGGLGISGGNIDHASLRYIFYGLAVAQIGLTYGLRRVLLRPMQAIDLAPRLTRLRARAILTAALAEGIALYGFVLVFLTNTARDFFLLAGVSLITQLFFFPRWSEWTTWLANRPEFEGLGGMSNQLPTIER